MTDLVNFEIQTNGVGHIILNRPKALNALSLEMLEALSHTLHDWRSNPNILTVLIEGIGERAFCAGGDIRAVYENREAVLSGEQAYFHIEYSLNELIFNYPKPYIALLDGITMGGGVGISIWGSHKIATERLLLAMPETSIGLFPDIGASYFLTRLPSHIGWYLGLTGNSINAYEALHLGLVDSVISHDDITAFKTRFDPKNITLPESITTDTTSELLTHKNDINDCFSQNSITDIIHALENKDAWCQNVAAILKTRSPLSLKVTFDYLNASVGKSFNEVMTYNHKLVRFFLESQDFYEGIRAAIIDKDKKPKWQHTIDEVDHITSVIL